MNFTTFTTLTTVKPKFIKMRITIAVTTAIVAATLAGCVVGPNYQRPPLSLPATWSAPLPNLGNTAKLRDWWASWGDSTLAELIENAQRENATVAIAAARIDQARAAYTAAASPLWPQAGANASQNLSRTSPSPAGGGSVRASEVDRIRSTSFDTTWEIDLFGKTRRAIEAETARSAARDFDWHDARISVAAEVATSYTNLRACEILVAGYEADASSRAETARLTTLKMQAGFVAPADAALSNASAAEAAGRLTQQRADCDIEIKALSYVSVIAEKQLREKLAATSAKFPILSAALAVDSVPALSLAQRPDVASAERELAAASAAIGEAEADRYPSITLTGSIGYNANHYGGLGTSGRTWSYGPSIKLPFFDAGRTAANADAARARYAEALATYKSKTARAVREVEEAFVRINSATNREADAKTALRGYESFLTAAYAKVKAGAGSLVELEEARRAVVASTGAVVNIERDRLHAWISLYRAVGGGWQDAPKTTVAASAINHSTTNATNSTASNTANNLN